MLWVGVQFHANEPRGRFEVCPSPGAPGKGSPPEFGKSKVKRLKMASKRWRGEASKSVRKPQRSLVEPSGELKRKVPKLESAAPPVRLARSSVVGSFGRGARRASSEVMGSTALPESESRLTVCNWP